MDAARNGLSLKFGQRITGLTITLSEGTTSLRGSIKLCPDRACHPGLYVHLVPAEKEQTEEVLRFFSATVNSDGTFALCNLPPGRYWAVARVAAENESLLDSKLRLPAETETRALVRRSAESAKTAVEFQPCQNVTDYRLALESAAPKISRIAVCTCRVLFVKERSRTLINSRSQGKKPDQLCSPFHLLQR